MSLFPTYNPFKRCLVHCGDRCTCTRPVPSIDSAVLMPPISNYAMTNGRIKYTLLRFEMRYLNGGVFHKPRYKLVLS
jgi:hypothetical protein